MANFLVYVAWALGDEDGGGGCLYVGRSFVGLSRFASHKTLQEQGKDLGLIELIWCDSEEEAVSLERKLIKEYEPTKNKIRYTGPTGPKDHRKTYLLKLDNYMFEKWQARASSEGKTLAFWIREKCNAEDRDEPSNQDRSEDGPRAERTRLRGQRTRVAPGGTTTGIRTELGRDDETRNGMVASSNAPEHHLSCTCGVCEFKRKHLKK